MDFDANYDSFVSSIEGWANDDKNNSDGCKKKQNTFCSVSLPLKMLASNEIPDKINYLIKKILFLFNVSSLKTYHGDAYLFFKLFSEMLHYALNIMVILRNESDSLENWENPPNFIKLLNNEIERKFIAGLFPTPEMEDANPNKRNFIDCFLSLLNDVAEKFGEEVLPLPIPVTEKYLESIYLRDYLYNFRSVTYTKNLFRSPNPARFTEAESLLENYLKDNNIKLIIDLRGANEAKKSEYINPLLKKMGINTLLVSFNEVDAKEQKENAAGYVKKLIYLKNVVHDIFKSVINTDGAILFHCASGKDRTGVLAALFQKLVGVKDEDAVYEYSLSGHDTRSERIQDVLEYLNKNGGISKYLEECGIDRKDQQRIIEKIKPNK
jgi:protein tyrosine/serine phosphatase